MSEYGADWSVAQAHYAYAGLDRPLLRNTPDGTVYYHADGLGSVVATSNAAGLVTASARYDAFGQTINKTGTIPRYGYAGREPDQSGLIYYRARSYDSGLGRFGQRDPAGFADGINPYAYVGNNPVSFSDPLGLMKSVPSIWTASTYPGSKSSNSGIGAQVASFGLGFTPAGVALDFATLLTGRDVITNEPVSRGWAIAGIIPGVSELRKTAKAVDGAADFAKGVKQFDIVPYRPTNSPLLNHHGINDVWAKNNIPGYKSRAADNPTMALNVDGHMAAHKAGNDYLREAMGSVQGQAKNLTPRQMQEMAERQFDAANVPREARQNFYNGFNRYIYGR